MIKCDKGSVEAEGEAINVLAEYYTLTMTLYKDLKESTDAEYAKETMNKLYAALINYCDSNVVLSDEKVKK